MQRVTLRADKVRFVALTGGGIIAGMFVGTLLFSRGNLGLAGAQTLGALLGVALAARWAPARKFDLHLENGGISGPNSRFPFFRKRVTIPLDDIDVASLPEIHGVFSHATVPKLRGRSGKAIALSMSFHTPESLRDFVDLVRSSIETV